jgi:large subunit ribosomal protein L25
VGAGAAAATGQGDVVPEPLDQGSGESMDAAEKSAQND